MAIDNFNYWTAHEDAALSSILQRLKFLLTGQQQKQFATNFTIFNFPTTKDRRDFHHKPSSVCCLIRMA